MAKRKSRKTVPEIPIIGEVDDWEEEIIKAILEVPEGGECIFYLDSAGGSMYGVLAVVSLLKLRKIRGTAVVLGECSSAALLLFAACDRRRVTPFSTFLFHRMRWESEKNIEPDVAAQWAHHFAKLEREIDEFQARLFATLTDQIKAWTLEGRYLTGAEIASFGLAELMEI